MKFIPAICPECSQFIMCKDGLVYVQCAACKQDITITQGLELLKEKCGNPAEITNVISTCLKLYKMYGEDLPLAVLDILGENFPGNEKVAYLRVKMSGYPVDMVRRYLEKFAHEKEKQPFAAQFLDATLEPRYMQSAEFFQDYIKNKLPGSPSMLKKSALQKLEEVKAEYVRRSETPEAKWTLYAFLIVSSILNVGGAIILVFLPWHILVGGAILVASFAVQSVVMFFHNKRYGNRLKIKPAERVLMTVFICTIPAAIGIYVAGWLAIPQSWVIGG